MQSLLLLKKSTFLLSLMQFVREKNKYILTTFLVIFLLFIINRPFYQEHFDSLWLGFCLIFCIIWLDQAIVVLFAILPLFLDQSGTQKAFMLELYLISLAIAFVIRGHIVHAVKGWKITSYDTLFFTFFCIFSLLAVLPFFNYMAALLQSGPSLVKTLFFIIHAEPTYHYYSLQQFFCLLINFCLFLGFLSWFRRSSITAKIVDYILLGLILSIIAGFLDWGNIISLTFWREKVIFMPLSATGSLKSLSGHEGWFSQYIVFFFVPVVTHLLIKKRMRIFWMTNFTLFVTVFLSGQIDGLFIFCTSLICIVLSNRDVYCQLFLYKKLQSLYTSAGRTKLIVSVILVILLLLTLVITLPVSYDRQISVKLTHRLSLWKGGLKIWSEEKLLGSGLGTFVYRYEDTFRDDSPDYVYYHLSAHSSYIQLLVELGIIGSIIFFAFVVSVLIRSGKKLFRSGDYTEKKASLLVFCGVLIFFFYGFTQYFFFLRALSVGFWVLLAFWLSLPGNRECSVPRIKSFILLVLLQIGILGPFFLMKPAFSTANNQGWYPVEKGTRVNYYRWSSPEAFLDLPPAVEKVIIEFQVRHPDISKRPVRVTFSVDDEVVNSTLISHKKSKKIWFQVESGKPHMLSVKVNRPWCPFFYHKSVDQRMLGVKIEYISLNQMDNYWEKTFHQQLQSEDLKQNSREQIHQSTGPGHILEEKPR